MEHATDSDIHKRSHTVTLTAMDCIDNTPSPDHLQGRPGDVFQEMSGPGRGSSRYYKYVKDNMMLSVATVSLVVCLVANWILMDVFMRTAIQDIKQGLILRENTSSDWPHPRVCSYMSLYLFKIREPEGETIAVAEEGPYVYRVDVEKVGVSWHANSTVSYREQYTLFYDQAKSGAKEPSLVTSLGISSPIPGNGSLGRELNVFTGQSDLSRLYQIHSWDHSTSLPLWGSHDGITIKGTDGSQFQPCLTESSQLALFYPQLLRTFDLKFSSVTTYKDLPIFHYTIPDSEFVNPGRSCSPSNTANITGASQGARGPSCSRPGLYSLSTDSTAVFISLPHFLGADPYYSQLVKGLHPQETKHRPFFEVDKVTGKTVMQKRRFQVNLHRPAGEEAEVYLPLYWVEMSQEVGDDDLHSIRRAREHLHSISVTCLYIGLALGLLLTAVLSVLVYRAVKRRKLPNQYSRLHPHRGRHAADN